MSLGSWFRDYVYFPLGGSRVEKKKMILNLFVVWILTGIWHGANWTFLVWGIMYFVLLAIEKLTGLPKRQGKFLNVVKWLYTMFFVILGWVIFRADNIGDAVKYIGYMFGINNCGTSLEPFKAMLYQSTSIILISTVCSTPVFKLIGKKIKENIFTDIIYACFIAAIFVLSVSSLVSSQYNPFIYFNF